MIHCNNTAFADVFNFRFGKKLIEPNMLVDVTKYHRGIIRDELAINCPPLDSQDDYLWQNAIVRIGHDEDERDFFLVMFCIDTICHDLPLYCRSYDTAFYCWYSRIVDEKKVAPVFNVIVYTGVEPWDAPTNLLKLCNCTPDELSSKGLSDYEVHLIPVQHLTSKEKERLTPEATEFLDSVCGRS